MKPPHCWTIFQSSLATYRLRMWCSLLWHGFRPWPGNFHMPQLQPKKKKSLQWSCALNARHPFFFFSSPLYSTLQEKICSLIYSWGRKSLRRCIRSSRSHRAQLEDRSQSQGHQIPTSVPIVINLQPVNVSFTLFLSSPQHCALLCKKCLLSRNIYEIEWHWNELKDVFWYIIFQ